MILRKKQRPQQKDIEVLITYPEENKTVERIVLFINSLDEKIQCISNGKIKQINISDIYHIESIDKIAVVFCEKDNYKTKYRLYQLYEKLIDKEFIQISKYCILNINKLDSIKQLFNSRMEATLTNGSRLYVNRKYIDSLEKKLMENG